MSQEFNLPSNSELFYQGNSSSAVAYGQLYNFAKQLLLAKNQSDNEIVKLRAELAKHKKPEGKK